MEADALSMLQRIIDDLERHRCGGVLRVFVDPQVDTDWTALKALYSKMYRRMRAASTLRTGFPTLRMGFRGQTWQVPVGWLPFV